MDLMANINKIIEKGSELIGNMDIVDYYNCNLKVDLFMSITLLVVILIIFVFCLRWTINDEDNVTATMLATFSGVGVLVAIIVIIVSIYNLMVLASFPTEYILNDIIKNIGGGA